MAGVDLAHSRDGVVGATLESATRRLTLAVIVVAGIVRLAIAALTPLFPDETYYWEWSRRLALGYFDHPPMIAWLIRAGTLVAGQTPLGVRLCPVLAGVVGTFFVCASARRVAGDRAALFAAIVFAVMPLSAAGLVLATPDAPLLAAVSATMYALLRALGRPPRSRASIGWWCATGAALGLALCSKYTAVLFPLGVFIALLSRGDLRLRLKEPGPYIATVVAVLVFAPVIAWNARHDWISFAFQLRHGFGDAAGSPLKRELEFIGGQLGLVSPILFAMCVLAVARSRNDPLFPLYHLLAIIPIVVFVFFMYSATRRRVEANWPAIAYLPAVLLLVAYGGNERWDKWLRGGIALAAILTLVTYVNAFVPILPVPARRDPAARASGWDDLARAVDRVYAKRLPLSSYRTFVAADRYQEASELAFHLPTHPETLALNLAGRANQYDLWPPFPERAHPRDALLLVLDDAEGIHPTAAMLEPHFTTLRQGEQVTLARNGDVVKRLRVWLLDGWRGTWPAAPLRSRT
jgi:4-amino-4-deoxy-L-arabinose transferase-like glycosyltransferase